MSVHGSSNTSLRHRTSVCPHHVEGCGGGVLASTCAFRRLQLINSSCLCVCSTGLSSCSKVIRMWSGQEGDDNPFA
eukprot:50761-Eustigmatos_ZCMA.PRE.1